MRQRLSVLLMLTLSMAGSLGKAAQAQERSLDVSVGRISFDRLPDDGLPASLRARPGQLTVSFRDAPRAGDWFQATGAVPVADDALAWALAGVGRRYLWPAGGSRFWAGADLTGQGYVFRERIAASGGWGGVVSAHAVGVINTGRLSIELRGGRRQQALSFLDDTSTRGVNEVGSRATFRGPVWVDVEARWLHAPEGNYPFAGATVFFWGHTPVYGWAQAGRWFGERPFDATAWTVGAGYAASSSMRIWGAVRQDASDPLYRNSARRSWSVGVMRVFGRTAPAPVPVARAATRRVVIRIGIAEAPAGPISIAGTFNGWQAQPMQREGDQWVIGLDLRPGVYEYTFRAADGSWFVPASVATRKSDGMGGESAVLVLP